MVETNKTHEPFAHISRRGDVSLKRNIVNRLLAILLGLLILGIIVVSTAKKGDGFWGVYASLWNGVFKTERKFWLFLQETALLLGVSLALVPAFKMKFWNLGGNGQILMGCLACSIVMFYLGGKLPDPVVWIIMLLASLLGGAIWAVIPAIFKAFFKTNESLFTLMLNYIAVVLVGFFISFWYPKSTGSMDPLEYANLPVLGEGQAGKSLLTILVVVALTIFIYVYLKFSKHGYELYVVGESENTARYIGINVKAVIIRTVILSGAICGLIGFLLTGSINHMVSTTMDGNMGFTGILVAWLAKFSPFVMALMSLFLSFISCGMSNVRKEYGFTSESISDVVIGIVYFCIIACEFFINYKIEFPAITAFLKTKCPKFYACCVKALDAIDKFNKKIDNACGGFFSFVFGKIKQFFIFIFGKVKQFFINIFTKVGLIKGGK